LKLGQNSRNFGNFGPRDLAPACPSRSPHFGPNRANSVSARIFSRARCHSECHRRRPRRSPNRLPLYRSARPGENWPDWAANRGICTPRLNQVSWQAKSTVDTQTPPGHPVPGSS